MQYYSSKAEAVAAAQARRAAGETVQVLKSIQWIAGSGRNVGYNAVRYFIKAVSA